MEHVKTTRPMKATSSTVRSAKSRAAMIGLGVLIAGFSLSCKASDSKNGEASATPQSPALEEPGSAAAATPIEGADEAQEVWRLASLRESWSKAGWVIDEERPSLPAVPTPEGTEVEGLALQRTDTPDAGADGESAGGAGTRGELFLYTYPREGYARAHERADLGNSATRRQGARLLVAYAADAERAESLLKELALP